ncbi:MAG: site-2 protease family protein [Pirellulaceae bacterium]
MRIGTFGGIGVYIHWTFWLLIAMYLFSVSASAGLAAGLVAVAFVISVFGCVTLHEFGHAGAAAAFGIRTTDITLLPIGGVARLTRMPEKPYQELLIALAGPAVNVVIATLLLIPVLIGLNLGGSVPMLAGQDFLVQLLAANIILVLFNLLPAFPMDGGRVLRSLIAMRTGHLRATEIAARVGRWMAAFFVIYGLWYSYWSLALVGGFIFFAGTAELLSARMQAAARQPPREPDRFAWQDSQWTTTTPLNREDVIDAVSVRQVN